MIQVLGPCQTCNILCDNITHEPGTMHFTHEPPVLPTSIPLYIFTDSCDMLVWF